MVFKNNLLRKPILLGQENPNNEIVDIERPSNRFGPYSYCRIFGTTCLLVIFPILSLKVMLLGTFYCYNAGEVGYIETAELFRRNVIMDIWESNFGSFLSNYYFVKRTPLKHVNIPHVDLPNPPVPPSEKCDKFEDGDKFDCLPRGDVNEQNCAARGCCYVTSTVNKVPFCYYPRDYNSYKYTNFNKTDNGFTATLSQQFKSPYPKDLPKLTLTASYLSDEVLLVTITDDKNTRYRVPFPELPSQSHRHLDAPLYEFRLNPNSTGFKIIRRSSNLTIFDTENVGGFIFSDQMIQLSAKLPSDNIFGLGESRHAFRVGADWRTITLHNHDRDPTDNVNGYGSHPVYLGMEPDGQAHGVFMLTSYSMDIVLQPSPAITYRVIGGPLILGFALGPTPVDVNTQYIRVIGKPYLPPYWSLGFHLCRFGYESLDDMKKIWNQTRTAGIPFDTQWTDLDYMQDQNDFTLSDKFKDLPKFVDHLHEIGMHYVILIDPGVSGSEPKGTYPPLDIGLTKGIFIKDSRGKEPLQGKVWNTKSTVFPDFTHPQAVPYWVQMITDFHKIVNFDGAWIDMNEPSNMVDGSLSGCPSNQLENPPYVPAVEGGKLNYKTVCMSSKHHDVDHYVVHNVYASLEAVITNFAMVNVRDGKRALVISRASSPGIGAYSGHWTGDVHSSWDDMAQSIPDMFSSSLFGIPLVGADICGFNDNTTVNLCSRWTQLGAFYPFSRNHNSDNQIAQDPVSLGLQDVAKVALNQRYTLLPYLYTLFWEAHASGTPVVRPTFYVFPDDVKSYDIEDQFFWGDGLLIAPVLKEGITYVTPYLPKGRWYFLGSSKESVAVIESKGQKVSIPAPESGPVPLLVRGGRILPCQVPALTTTESRKNPYFLIVALDSSNSAVGSLYIDDGETYEGSYNLMTFEAKNNSLFSKIISWTWNQKLTLGSLTILGNFTSISSVKINDQPLNFTSFLPKALDIHDINWDLKKEFTVSWSF